MFAPVSAPEYQPPLFDPLTSPASSLQKGKKLVHLLHKTSTNNLGLNEKLFLLILNHFYYQRLENMCNFVPFDVIWPTAL